METGGNVAEKLPEVDKEFLARCLGLSEWPEWLKLQNWFQCYAARTLTDAHRPYDTDQKIHAEIALRSAESWIEQAYQRGRRDGTDAERRSWEKKIRKMFDFREN
jgi:hypothetical protein